MDSSRIISLVIFTLTPVILSGILSFKTMDSIKTWYKDLIKPKLNPPNWIFGPVWTTLYLMIGLSGFIIWDTNKGFNIEDKNEWIIYFLQLLANFLWTPIFFGYHKIFLALIDIILMIVLISINIIIFYKKSVTAAYLLIPYLLWVSFATYINFSLWILNRKKTINRKN